MSHADGASETKSDLDTIVAQVLESYRSDGRGQFVNRKFLPSREEIIAIIQLFLQLFYPGYYGRQDLTDENLPYHVGGLVTSLRDKLARQIELCLCHAAHIPIVAHDERYSPARAFGQRITVCCMDVEPSKAIGQIGRVIKYAIPLKGARNGQTYPTHLFPAQSIFGKVRIDGFYPTLYNKLWALSGRCRRLQQLC